MLITSLLLACSSTGADITLTDLDDPSGVLSDSWTADTAFWYWSESETSLWTLSETSQTLELVGEVRIDPLSLTTSGAQCEDLQDWLDVGSALVDGLAGGEALADHCDAVGTYFSDMTALDDSDGSERLTVTAYIEDLVGGTPGTGTWTEGDVNGALFWNDGQSADPGDGWDGDGCAYTWVDPGNSSQLWTFPELTLTIDEADDSVVGTLDAELLGDDGGTGTLSAEFDAELCQYTGGAVVLPGL